MKGKHEHTQYRFGDRMEQSTLSGRRVGILEDEVPATRGGTYQLPPSGTAPSAQLDEGGEWLVVYQDNGDWDWRCMEYDSYEEAVRIYDIVRRRNTTFLSRIIAKDPC